MFESLVLLPTPCQAVHTLNRNLGNIIVALLTGGQSDTSLILKQVNNYIEMLQDTWSTTSG